MAKNFLFVDCVVHWARNKGNRIHQIEHVPICFENNTLKSKL